MDRKLDELLFALMQNMTIAVSGEKLAEDLNVSHSTISRWVEKLRGFVQLQPGFDPVLRRLMHRDAMMRAQ